MLKNPFSSLNKKDYILWIVSLITVGISGFLSPDKDPITIIGTLIGVTGLIFLAKGNVWGQILIITFSLLYSITSYTCRYYGEIITYVGMTLPSSCCALITWLKNPFADGENVVKIHKLSKTQIIFMIFLTVAVTFIFYFILKFFNTNNLIWSTLSVATSFLASYLAIFRSSYYALAYGANDIVLIILWISASIENPAYTPMIFCFLAFFVNDLYGFINWKKREKEQNI